MPSDRYSFHAEGAQMSNMFSDLREREHRNVILGNSLSKFYLQIGFVPLLLKTIQCSLIMESASYLITYWNFTFLRVRSIISYT